MGPLVIAAGGNGKKATENALQPLILTVIVQSAAHRSDISHIVGVIDVRAGEEYLPPVL